MKRGLRELWDNINCPNTHVTGVPEGEERKRKKEKRKRKK